MYMYTGTVKSNRQRSGSEGPGPGQTTKNDIATIFSNFECS